MVAALHDQSLFGFSKEISGNIKLQNQYIGLFKRLKIYNCLPISNLLSLSRNHRKPCGQLQLLHAKISICNKETMNSYTHQGVAKFFPFDFDCETRHLYFFILFTAPSPHFFFHFNPIVTCLTVVPSSQPCQTSVKTLKNQPVMRKSLKEKY